MKILLAVAFVFALAVIVFSYFSHREAEQFLKTAERAEGRVIAKKTVVTDPKNQRKEQQVSYRFADATGQEYTGTEKVEYADVWDALSEGQVAGVLYNRENPGQNRLEILVNRRMGVARAVLGGKLINP